MLIPSNPRGVRAFALTALPLMVMLAARPNKPAIVRAAWTVMIYQDLDNSLEAPGIENLKEMIRVGGSENVQVVVLCDRSPKSEPKDQYSDEGVSTLKNWDGARLLHLEKGR